MYERIIDLIGKENFAKLEQAKILLVGCGGVGSFAYLGLIRSGFKNITVIDKDKVELSNLNRQLVANLKTIGLSKVEVAKSMASDLNKDIKISAIEEFLDENNINNLDKDFDFIIDACDTLKTKLELIRFAHLNHIKIISAMGMGNRVEAHNIKITTLDKTKNDPLAKNLRKLVRDNQIDLKIPVCYNESLPLKKGKVNSMITSPGIAGLLIADYIINELLFTNQKVR